MLDIVLVVLGAALVLSVLGDALVTTVTVSEGAGSVTRRVTGLLWRGLLRLHRTDSDSTLLAVGGPALVLLAVLLWVIGLWAGWALVLSADDGTLVDSTTRVPVGLVDTLYFTGFTIFTLGVGDVVADSSWARLVSAVASFSGLVLVTLAITYLISVVSAAVARRALAVQISGLGSTADRIAAQGWDGTGFSDAFVQHLVNLSGQITSNAEQQLAYPVMQYFHTRSRGTAATVALATLDDATLILQHAVAAHVRPDSAAVVPLRSSIERHTETLHVNPNLAHDAELPPAPDLTALIEADVPLVADEEFDRHVELLQDRRQRMARIVRSDGWSW